MARLAASSQVVHESMLTVEIVVSGRVNGSAMLDLCLVQRHSKSDGGSVREWGAFCKPRQIFRCSTSL